VVASKLKFRAESERHHYSDQRVKKDQAHRVVQVRVIRVTRTGSFMFIREIRRMEG
jgi:hypothetical protein